MSFDHPHTPQSPSTFSIAHLPPKPSSPQTTTSLPTPAHSINGSTSSITSDMTSDPSMFEDGSHKRKRDIGDHGDQEQKKAHIENSRFGINDLHIDVGPKYLLCKTPHSGVRPHPSQDLFALYGLSPVAASVVRLWPDGSKNTLRKSYKGKIKDSGISGNFDVVKKDLEASDTLFAMAMQPQEEWDMQFVRGKEVEKGLPEIARSSLGKAMTMLKGDLTKADWDSKVLGELGPASSTIASKTARIGIKAPTPAPVSAIPQNTAINRVTKGEIPRPRRNIKKRAYDDTSFVGYGEGFVDDGQDDGGYSTGDGNERGQGQKRRKKTPVGGNHGQHGLSGDGGTWGPGMIGS
ncbi:Rox3 mediator complex subunit [Phlyctema vagabunda]|uniref:Mediator of RNA polymerase II transcription subunit 19 n=1 Tax=Phlyctema vagabunda TaxID=108571 RepID=A0ABR4PX41_9HELO